MFNATKQTKANPGATRNHQTAGPLDFCFPPNVQILQPNFVSAFAHAQTTPRQRTTAKVGERREKAAKTTTDHRRATSVAATARVQIEQQPLSLYSHTHCPLPHRESHQNYSKPQRSLHPPPLAFTSFKPLYSRPLSPSHAITPQEHTAVLCPRRQPIPLRVHQQVTSA
jgi:hypothetical protein